MHLMCPFASLLLVVWTTLLALMVNDTTWRQPIIVLLVVKSFLVAAGLEFLSRADHRKGQRVISFWSSKTHFLPKYQQFHWHRDMLVKSCSKLSSLPSTTTST
ncbi:hypothetical protein CEXT_454441 [Caerostris extrusa]|uniref:Secreted protein n=1 Tax=Caerostris extrusa TaxID=172846 RepID=A0AAV4QUG5_CAEEX|nr:hypothetical protein CEXT_454441 [Caerostris extrusa]